MRRGMVGPGGKAALLKERERKLQMAGLGEEILAMKVDAAKELCKTFRTQLSAFASTYRDKINTDPKLRKDFTDMCLAIGVDPLAFSSWPGEDEADDEQRQRRGVGAFLQKLLGTTASRGSSSAQVLEKKEQEAVARRARSQRAFYADLAVRVMTTCLTTRKQNGGLLLLTELLQILNGGRNNAAIESNTGACSTTTSSQTRASSHVAAAEEQLSQPSSASQEGPRPATTEITEKDVLMAVELLETSFGSGVTVKRLANDVRVVSSVPEELDTDQNLVLEFAGREAGVLPRDAFLRDERFQLWSPSRVEKVLRFFVREQLCWVDRDPESGAETFWFPSMTMTLLRVDQDDG
ncbi:unnamed protein product [Amoebophrya sp. A120]|nr:unnamed protein product [Amoebophrya sp. A120]|eukprot:GSA120T00017715001.1